DVDYIDSWGFCDGKVDFLRIVKRLIFNDFSPNI
ncbi:MAG: hypothetical protein RJA04_1279, partial [Bacteroidota bacterium]